MSIREWYIRYHEIRMKLEALRTIRRDKCAAIARKQVNDECKENKEA